MPLKHILASAPLLFALFLLSACTNLDTAPSQDRQVRDQFEQIRSYITEDMGGSIPVPRGEDVAWEETEQYRVFHVGEYSIVQIPKTFNKNKFQLVFLDGRMERVADYQPLLGETNIPEHAYAALQRASQNNTTLAPKILEIQIGEHKNGSQLLEGVKTHRPDVYAELLKEPWSKVRVTLNIQGFNNRLQQPATRADGFATFDQEGRLISLKLQVPTNSPKTTPPKLTFPGSDPTAGKVN